MVCDGIDGFSGLGEGGDAQSADVGLCGTLNDVILVRVARVFGILGAGETVV